MQATGILATPRDRRAHEREQRPAGSIDAAPRALLAVPPGNPLGALGDEIKEFAMGLFEGKRGLILGVANDHSIAWAIAQFVMAEGGVCGFTHLPDRPD